jgi:hypothetical protein
MPDTDIRLSEDYLPIEAISRGGFAGEIGPQRHILRCCGGRDGRWSRARRRCGAARPADRWSKTST